MLPPQSKYLSPQNMNNMRDLDFSSFHRTARDWGEIEAAMEKKIPRLIEVSDIKGDLHVHSNGATGHIQ
jgi:hypothetical protein